MACAAHAECLTECLEKTSSHGRTRHSEAKGRVWEFGCRLCFQVHLFECPCQVLVSSGRLAWSLRREPTNRTANQQTSERRPREHMHTRTHAHTHTQTRRSGGLVPRRVWFSFGLIEPSIWECSAWRERPPHVWAKQKCFEQSQKCFDFLNV